MGPGAREKPGGMEWIDGSWKGSVVHEKEKVEMGEIDCHLTMKLHYRGWLSNESATRGKGKYDQA